MNDRPLILITNDDGVEAKGIKELTECLRDLGDIVVFAPDGPRSGMASAITSLVPIKYTLVRKEKGLTVYSCTGTPVDCVKLAINEVLERKPDLLVATMPSASSIPVRWGQLPKDACSVFLRWACRSWIIVRMPTLPRAAV